MKRHTIANVGPAAIVTAAWIAVATPTTASEQAQRNDYHTAGTQTHGVHGKATPASGEEG